MIKERHIYQNWGLGVKVLKQCLTESEMKYAKSNYSCNQSLSLVELKKKKKKSVLFLVLHGESWEGLCAKQDRGITKPITFESSHKLK